MKSIKFLLAAFVVSAMFASCAKEEMIVAPENQNGEFVGAELIGSNLAVNFTAGDPSTKVTNGAWDASDRLGLGWVISGTVGSTQDRDVRPADNNLYANHMFQKNGDDLTTKGNIYAGWHFGYYPFVYQEGLGAALNDIDINPAQKAVTGEDEIKTSALHLSPLRFLSKKDLNENYEFKEGTVFPVYNVVKTIKVNVKPSAEFAASDILKNTKITGVTINAGKDVNIFADTVDAIHPELLDSVLTKYPTAGYYYSVDTTKINFYNNLNEDDVIEFTADSVITTTVDCATITLGAEQTLRVNTLPMLNNNVDSTKITITVHTANGDYVVNYVNDKLATGNKDKVQSVNDKALAKLAKAYKGNDDSLKAGALSAWNLNASGNYRPGITLDIEITPAMFKENFQIESVTDWNNAVAFVNASDLDAVVFNLAKDIKFTSNIVLPESAKLTVNGSNKIVLDGATAWAGQTATNNKFVVNVPVEVAKDITVNGLMQADSITNKAVINAGATADIKGLNNTADGSKVIVAYGAKVNVNAGGVIAYVVDDVTADGISKINMLIDKTANDNNIEVNTLIVKTALNLDAVAKPSIDGSYGTTDAVILKDLSKVDIILEGGSLVGKVNSTTPVNTRVNVKSVTAISGTTAITNVSIGSTPTLATRSTTSGSTTPAEIPGELKVLGGTLTAKDVIFKSIDVVTVAKGAGLVITQTEGVNQYIEIASLDVEGTATVSVSGLTVGTVKVDGQLAISEGSHMVHTSAPQVTGSVAGIIKSGAANQEELKDMITLAKNGETIYIANDFTLTDQISINKNVTLNFNGNTITGSGIWNDTEGVKTWSLISVSGKDVAVTITGNPILKAAANDSYAVDVRNEASVTIENGEFTGNVSAVYATNGAKAYIKGGTYDIQQKSEFNDSRYLLNLKDKDDTHKASSIVVSGGTFKNFNPAASLSENPQANFVAEGYQSVKVGATNNYQVVAK